MNITPKRTQDLAATSRMLPVLLMGAALMCGPVAASPAGHGLAELIDLHQSAQGDAPRGSARYGAPLDSVLSPKRSAHRLALAANQECPELLRHSFVPIQGGPTQSMCQYQGKVLLVVNTASECGYTYQYEGLEALYSRYRHRGLVVVGFPSNDFGGQEPGSNKDIAEFCRTVYGVGFPMFEKQASGKLTANPLYASLMTRTGDAPRWNFHKYLVDRNGQKVMSFTSKVEPGSRELTRAIEHWLAEKPQTTRVN